MKTMILLSLLITSSYSFAGSILECRSNTNDALYELAIADGNRKLIISPLVADDSALSSGAANLRYNEGESSPENTLYEGQNDNGNKIALILNAGTTTFIKKSEVIVAEVYYTDKNPNFMSGKATLNCSLR